jgi:hypothetical protein
LTELMGGFGARFAAHPGQAYAEFAGGLAAPAPPLGQALRWQAVAEVAREHATVMLGGRPLNIRGSYTDMLMAIENAGQIPEMIAGYQRVAQRHGMGNQDMTRLIGQQMFGTPNMYTTAQVLEGLQTRAALPGGIAGALTAPAPLQGEEATIARRLLQQQEDPAAREGFLLMLRDAQKELMGETEVVRTLTHVQEQMTSAFARGVEILQTHGNAMHVSQETLDQLNPALRQLTEWVQNLVNATGGLNPVVPMLRNQWQQWWSGGATPPST